MKKLQDPYAPEPGGAATVSDWCKQPNVHDPACSASPVAMTLDNEINAVLKHMMCQRKPETCEAKPAKDQKVMPKEEKASNAKTGEAETRESKASTAENGKEETEEGKASNAKTGKEETEESKAGNAKNDKEETQASKASNVKTDNEGTQEGKANETRDIKEQRAPTWDIKKEGAPAVVEEGVEELDTEEAAKELGEQVAKLGNIKENLAKKGQLDPELDRTLTKMIETGTKTAKAMHALADMSAEDASKELDVLKADVEDVGKAVFEFETEVHPHGYKWWRYRWEYAFVEANVLNVLVLITMLLYLLINWAEAKMFKFSPVLDSTGISVVNLYHKSFERCLHEVMILGLIAFIIWAMEEAGFFTLFISNNPVRASIDEHSDQQFHWPTTSQHVIYTLRTVNMHLFLGMLIYYLLMFHISHGAMCILELFMRHENPDFFQNFMAEGVESQHFQDKIEMTPELTKKAAVVHECFAKKGPLGKLLANDGTMSILFGHLDKAEDYQNLKKYFAAHVKYHEGFENLHELITVAPIYPYMARKLYSSLEAMIVVDWQVWLMVQLVLVVQACVHYYAHLAVVELLPVTFLFGSLILASQYIWTRRRLAYAVKETSQVSDVSEGRTSSELKAREVLERWLLRLQQLNFFFICFSAARLTCSSFFWTDYFQLSCILLAAFLVMYALFVVIGSLAVPMFVIMLSLPPNITEEDHLVLKEMLEEHEAAGVKLGNSGRRRQSKLCAVGMVVV